MQKVAEHLCSPWGPAIQIGEVKVQFACLMLGLYIMFDHSHFDYICIWTDSQPPSSRVRLPGEVDCNFIPILTSLCKVQTYFFSDAVLTDSLRLFGNSKLTRPQMPFYTKTYLPGTYDAKLTRAESNLSIIGQ